MGNLTRLAVFTLVIYAIPIAALTYTCQFRDWYPQYGHIFETIKNEDCADEYQSYLGRDKNPSKIDVLGGGGQYTVLTQPVINCILNHTSQYVMNGMTNAQVLLGIMPTVLALVGASTEEMSMLANVGRRPLLALLLAAGSPSVYFSRAFEYSGPREILSETPDRMQQWRPRNWFSKLLVSGPEYIIALAAIGNIAVMNWELGVRTICSFWNDAIIAPTLWACLGVVLHVLGTFVLRLRLRGWRGREEEVRRAKHEAEEKKKAADKARKAGAGRNQDPFGLLEALCLVGGWFFGVPKRFCGILRTEFVPSAAEPFEVRILQFKETKTFLVAAWTLSMLTIFHIIYGTLVFASTTFIGTHDALIIVARYMGSVALCRIVLMYELAGIRESRAEDERSGSGAGKGESFKAREGSVVWCVRQDWA
jgi:hypothetical protein